MAIHRLLENEAFDPKAFKIIAAAFDDALRELGSADRNDPWVARRIITFAQYGERDPIKLRDLALKLSVNRRGLLVRPCGYSRNSTWLSWRLPPESTPEVEGSAMERNPELVSWMHRQAGSKLH